MIELVDPNDSRAVRNKDNVLELYELMINQKKSEDGTAKFVSPAYIQHNPLIPDGSVALGQFFGKVTRERERARVVVHRIIAVGDYVWAHVNFLNLFNDDPQDTGIAGVDIYKMDADGKAVEHWDTLQLVGNPKDSAPLIAPIHPLRTTTRALHTTTRVAAQCSAPRSCATPNSTTASSLKRVPWLSTTPK